MQEAAAFKEMNDQFCKYKLSWGAILKISICAEVSVYMEIEI